VPPEVGSHATGQTGVISVLLVDDEPDFHLLAKEMLGRLGLFEVTSAASVDEAYALLEGGHYDVVLADYFMPGTNGIELLRKLRDSGSDIPFVVVTGRGREDVAIDALNSGADFYLQKGGDVAASIANLSNVIVKLVRSRAAERSGIESLDEALSQLRELDSIINQSPVVVATWTAAERRPMSYISPNVSLLGYSSEDFMSGRTSYLDLVHPDDLPGLKAAVAECSKSLRLSCMFEYRIFTRSGEMRWIDERTLVVRKDGVPVAWQCVLLDVTDRKLAENRLHDLAMIVDSSRDAIYRLDLEARIMSWNKAAEELYGYSAAEVIGTKVDFLIPDDIRDKVAQVKARVVKGERIDHYESVRVRKDGTLVDVSISLSPVKDDSGAVVGLSAIARGISERKKAERLLVESELKYRTLFDGANDAIYIMDPDGRILDVNKMACEQTGYSRAELVGKSILEIDASKEAVSVPMRIGRLKRQGVGFFETVNKAKDGREYPVEVNSRMVEYVGRPALMGLVRDITERKMSEEALKAVMSSLEGLESIVNASPAVVFQWTYSEATGRCVQFVSNNVQQFGYTPSEFMLQARRYDDLIHPDDRAVVASDISKYHRAGVEDFNLEYRVVAKDGEVRWVDDRTTVVKGDAGSPVRQQGIVMDITARRLAEDALKVANEKLSILGSITRHDVANQLGIVLGALSLLEEDVDDDARRTHIGMMREAVSTISQQLEFAGSYQKAGTKPPEWVHVRLDLAGAVSSIGLGDVRVESDLGNMEVWADPMFEKVLFNLLDNSVRHGGAITRIRIFAERRGDAAVIVYEDDGVGVPPEEKELIFGKGYGKNTGHGLFLSREILGMTGMTIVENGEPGKGSRFEIFVPPGRHRG